MTGQVGAVSGVGGTPSAIGDENSRGKVLLRRAHRFYAGRAREY